MAIKTLRGVLTKSEAYIALANEVLRKHKCAYKGPAEYTDIIFIHDDEKALNQVRVEVSFDTDNNENPEYEP